MLQTHKHTHQTNAYAIENRGKNLIFVHIHIHFKRHIDRLHCYSLLWTVSSDYIKMSNLTFALLLLLLPLLFLSPLAAALPIKHKCLSLHNLLIARTNLSALFVHISVHMFPFSESIMASDDKAIANTLCIMLLYERAWCWHTKKWWENILRCR